jgi:hypothetical protein
MVAHARANDPHDRSTSTSTSPARARSGTSSPVRLYGVAPRFGAVATQCADTVRHVEGEPRNAASEAVRAGFANMTRLRELGDTEMRQFRNRFADDYTREDRRRLVGVPSSGREDWFESIQAYWELGMGPPTFSVAKVLAVRAERLVLFLARVEYPQGPATEMLIVYGLSVDGKAQRSVMFDADDIDAALAELDRQHADIENAHASPPTAD